MFVVRRHTVMLRHSCDVFRQTDNVGLQCCSSQQAKFADNREGGTFCCSFSNILKSFTLMI